MNSEVKTRMLDVIAFLTARFKDDEAAAIVLLGLDKDDASPEEIAEGATRLTNILLGMTDFAISAVGAMAMMVGASTEQMMEIMCMQMAMWETHG